MSRWILPKENKPLLEAIQTRFACTSTLAKILINRGFTDLKKIDDYLNPCMSQTHNPFLLKDMDKAVSRIHKAIQNQEGILVHGDYDVDGVTSASLLYLGLKELGAKNCSYFLPNRLVDGYGVSLEALNKAKKEGFSLMITCDCGITAIKALEHAEKLDMDVIVTDHHEPQEHLPPALAVINPKQKDCDYPFKELAGVGVAFKLLQALGLKESSMDLLALGTVADVVPLKDENRIFVTVGLLRLQKTEKIGLQSLLEVSDLWGKDFGSGHVGFQLAPRINAIGRLGDPTDGLRMIISDDYVFARNIAKKLDLENKKRKSIEKDILNEAKQMVLNDSSYKENKVLVLYQALWHQGVIGIVASRIVEHFHKPCLMIGAPDQEGYCKASCRSIPAFHVLDALAANADHLQGYGGHAYAAGFSIHESSIEAFRKDVNSYANTILTIDDCQAEFSIDAIVSLGDLTWNLQKELEERLAPFGASNVRPLFASKGVYLKSCPRVVGRDHLRLELGAAIGTSWTAMAFQKIALLDTLSECFRQKKSLHLLYHFVTNSWQGETFLQLHVKDIWL